MATKSLRFIFKMFNVGMLREPIDTQQKEREREQKLKKK